MAPRHSDDFKRDAVRIARTSGLTMRQVASDLGIGLSRLSRCCCADEIRLWLIHAERIAVDPPGPIFLATKDC